MLYFQKGDMEMFRGEERPVLSYKMINIMVTVNFPPDAYIHMRVHMVQWVSRLAD